LDLKLYILKAVAGRIRWRIWRSRTNGRTLLWEEMRVQWSLLSGFHLCKSRWR